MLIRIRSTVTGATHRIESGSLESAVKSALGYVDFTISTDPTQGFVSPSKLSELGLKFICIPPICRYGDIVFVKPSSSVLNETPVDDVDAKLSMMPSTVSRETISCQHGPNIGCEHCLHQDVWNEAFLESKGIDHSFSS